AAALSILALALPATATNMQFLALQEATQMESRRVVVGEDGNGAVATTFATTVVGEDVHYVLIVQNGAPIGPRQPAPVSILQVTLNGDVVFQREGPFGEERTPVALITDGTSNTIMIAAGGAPGSAALVTVVALKPLPIPVGGRSVLPLAAPSTSVVVGLTIHNAGPANVAARLELFNADGSSAGV